MSAADFPAIEVRTRQLLDDYFGAGTYILDCSWQSDLESFRWATDPMSAATPSLSVGEFHFGTSCAGNRVDFGIHAFVNGGYGTEYTSHRIFESIVQHYNNWKETRLRRQEHSERQLEQILSRKLGIFVRVAVHVEESVYNHYAEVSINASNFRMRLEVQETEILDRDTIVYILRKYSNWYCSARSANYDSPYYTGDNPVSYTAIDEMSVLGIDAFRAAYQSTISGVVRQTSGGIKRNDNARELLLLHLSDDQLQEYEHGETITCVGNQTGNTYRILPKSQINIEIVENISNHSRGKKKACVVPERGMPIEDHMLGQLLLIQNNEDVFLDKVIYW